MFDLSVIANWSQIISVIVAVIIGLASYQQGRRARRRPTLTYAPDTIFSPFVINADNFLENELEIRYKGKAIQNLRFLQISLINTSSVAIRKSHIVEPIAFIFESGSQLLTVPQVVTCDPPNLRADFVLGAANVVSLHLELFNPGDKLTVKFVWSGSWSEPEVSARIEGITGIDRVEHDELTVNVAFRYLSHVFLSVILLGIAFAVLVASRTGQVVILGLQIPLDSLAFGISLGAMLSWLLGVLLQRIRLRRAIMQRRPGLQVRRDMS